MASDTVVNLKSPKVACEDCRLGNICLPRGLDLTEVVELNNIIGRGQPLSKGEILYHQGDNLHSFFAIHSGSLRSYTVTQDGAEQTLGFYLPGELVGLDGLENNDHSCTTVALETTSVCEIPFYHLQALCSNLPSLQRQMLHLLGKELSGEQDILLLLGTRSAEERLAVFLLSLSNRFFERGFSATEFNLSMSRHDISNFLGVAVETISRQFSHFDKKQILRVKHRNVKIIDMGKLEQIVTPCRKSDYRAKNNSSLAAV